MRSSSSRAASMLVWRAGLRQKAHHRRADREVGELTQLLDPVERVDARVMGEVEQRLGAHGQLGVVEHLLDQRLDGLVVRLVEDADRLGAHLARLVLQQPADGRVRGVLAGRSQQPQRVEHLGRVRRRSTASPAGPWRTGPGRWSSRARRRAGSCGCCPAGSGRTAAARCRPRPASRPAAPASPTPCSPDQGPPTWQRPGRTGRPVRRPAARRPCR